jgi:hypothetical protein
VGKSGERRDRHLRPQIAAADADVDDVAQGQLAAVGARPHRFGESEHRLEHALHLGRMRRRAGGRAQRRMQHGAAFGRVDRRSGEHRVAQRLDAAFARQVGEEAQRCRVDQALREIGEHFGRFEAEMLEARRVAGEGFAQVEVTTVRLVVAAQGRPRDCRVAARERRHRRA